VRLCAFHLSRAPGLTLGVVMLCAAGAGAVPARAQTTFTALIVSTDAPQAAGVATADIDG